MRTLLIQQQNFNKMKPSVPVSVLSTNQFPISLFTLAIAFLFNKRLVEHLTTVYPSFVTFRNRGVAETEFIHQANKKKIDSLQQSIDENQVVKNG
ncbi:conserved hypothetical protein [Hyella patelloides LEGE 07179]|uniref:Uncharacterized protein n=1 Tax=Hyella patelloides LEGE 07179 TaxID=945734 RepID=A0A563W585_9CYAN|nr:conserved hypothetical protein [Hyella patelloides LEGE 07179]